MDNPQQLECDTPDCIHWQEGGCAKETAVLIQEHHCTDYEERITLPSATVTIEVSGGVVQNVYASPDLPDIGVELIDFDNLREESETAETHSRQLLSMTHKPTNTFSEGGTYAQQNEIPDRSAVKGGRGLLRQGRSHHDRSGV